MDYGNDFQKLHQSVPVTTQPTTPEQIRYFSKHATERNVFKWTTTVLQGTHGFLAFAAWTAIYAWMFQNLTWLLWIAPLLAGFSLLAMHVIFRATWETYWYDKLDADPNTDSPIYVPVAIILLLLVAEVNGVQRFLTAQVKPPETRAADHIEADHTTTVASIEQSYRNDKAAIEATYREKERAATLPYDRQLRSARNRSTDTPEERLQRRQSIASLERQRDAALAPVFAAKSNALEKALNAYTAAKDAANTRRQTGVAEVDTHNAAENTRYTTDLGKVGSYAWIISVGLLALIMMLSYRVVRINVKSGIIARRNYTVLDAHGNPLEVAVTALFDAFKRQWLRLWVGVHRALSPKEAITSFDGTVIAQPGTYNTFPAPPTNDEDEALRKKVAEKILDQASRGEVRITPELLNEEFQRAKTMNGTYKNTPLGKPEPSPAPARPAEGGPAAPSQQRTHPPTPNQYTADTADNDEPRWIKFFRDTMLAQIAAYDQAIAAGNTRQAQIHQDALTDPTDPTVKLGRRLGLAWGIYQGDVHVWRNRTPGIKVPLQNLTVEALNGTTPPAELTEDGEPVELFKQNLELFKQKIQAQKDPETGKVVGILYKKEKSGEWVTYPYTQVKAFWTNYVARCDKSQSPANLEGLEKWQYAMSLFDEGRVEMRETLQPVVL